VTQERVDPIEAIRNEIARLGADEGSVPAIDAIYVDDQGDGYARLRGSSRGVDFLSDDEKVETILEHLAELDEAEGLNGPELIRSEFSGPPKFGRS
jgi:hypothetical protein